MSVVLLFGAGASAFSDDRSTTPPLGVELFDRLLGEGGPAADLPPELIAMFRRDGFEVAMACLLELGSQAAIDFVRQVAEHLFYYRAGADNLYCRLVDALQVLPRCVLFSSLNYDTLLEQALVRREVIPAYSPVAPVPDGHQLVLKLHGSSNLLPVLPRSMASFRGNSAAAEVMASGRFLRDLPMKYALHPEHFLAWKSDPRHDNLTPVLSLYARGKKGLVNNDFLECVQQYWAEQIKAATAVILIGVRFTPEDAHLWQPLGASTARLLVVDPQPEDLLLWANKVGREGPSLHLAASFSDIDSIVSSVLTYG